MQLRKKPMNEAEILFTEILGCQRHNLYLDKDKRLDQEKSAFISQTLKRRINGEPLDYILGKTEFMGLEFKVDNRVLIPRADTEVLVEAVIELSQEIKGEIKILDVGTGSGCIAISLAKFIPRAFIDAVDISPGALEVAKINAGLNNVKNRVQFSESDLFQNIRTGEGKYDIIVSNPPYIVRREIERLSKEVRHEPRAALDGGLDGLDFYRRIIKEPRFYLKDNGFLVLEIGFGQRNYVENILQEYEYFNIIKVIKDYNNIDRVLVAQMA
ncbi:peptide chain release factor N(5)-glutamine methyltransferase [bacterium]|nr:MAG: peptide chain release factor N(5)-glutamine methyltransferase [bacterium]